MQLVQYPSLAQGGIGIEVAIQRGIGVGDQIGDRLDNQAVGKVGVGKGSLGELGVVEGDDIGEQLLHHR